MNVHIIRKCFAAAISAAMTFTAIPLVSSETVIDAKAVSADYAPQLMYIASYDDSANLSASDTKDTSSLGLTAENGSLSEQWRIDYCGADSNGGYYKIVNASSGRLITPFDYSAAPGAETVIFGNENDHSQYWYIIPTDKDSYGNDLHYKIVNYADPDLALTWENNSAGLSEYSGAVSQQWLLDPAGLQGFAGYSKDGDKVKAADIGGLLGETVEITNFDDLKKYATSDTPYTIVVTKDISVTELNLNGTRYMCSAGRIYLHNNKTIIGSYESHTLYNVQFCTSSKSGVGDNIIIKNFESRHDKDSNNNDSIQFYFGSGKNIWADHITFVGHDGYGKSSNGEVDEDKFLACCYDADFCTVSDCSFGSHKYGLILGYPADGKDLREQYGNYPHMSLISNKFNDTNTRGPGLMRWGYFHSLNNYVNNFSMAYTVISECKIFAENCVYENGGNVICDWDKVELCGYYSETGSTFSGCQRTKQGGDSNSTAQPCTWRPSSNYTYKALTAEQAKSYCSSYSGAQSAQTKINYTVYQNAGVPSAGFMAGVDEGWGTAAPAEIPVDAYFMIKNVNSGLYLDVAGGAAENGTNIQQWGASEAAVQNTWRFVPAGDGAYYIQSMTGDKTYVLDVTAGKTENGTNIELYSYKANNNQKFMLTENSDGSYKIRPINNTDSYVEIASASADAGANCALWEKTGSACQDWILEEVTFSGEIMDTEKTYMFKNADSGLYMEVADGADEDGANIQQWEANGDGDNNSGAWNTWTLKPATGDLYYIVSGLKSGKYLTISEDNAQLGTADTKTNVQMMRFVKNPDGTYCIVTRASYNKATGRYTKGIEASDAGSGGNIRQWELNGNSCQSWVIEAVEPPKVIGDCNDDGEFSIADAVMLRKWLLGSGELTNGENGDLCKDGIINVFDLCAMKKLLVESR